MPRCPNTWITLPSRCPPAAAAQPVVLSESDGAVVYSHDRPIVIHGIPEAVVVDTGDVLLVTTKEQSAGLGGVVASLGDDLNRLR